MEAQSSNYENVHIAVLHTRQSTCSLSVTRHAVLEILKSILELPPIIRHHFAIHVSGCLLSVYKSTLFDFRIYLYIV